MCEDVFVVDRECLGPIMQHLKSGEKKFHKRHVPILQIYNFRRSVKLLLKALLSV